MILLIDNYDSFTYNLYQYIGIIQQDIKVVRNNEITIEQIQKLTPSHIVISPGPGYPRDAGISIEVIKRFHKSTPILGVCLGHQAIGEAFGGRITHASSLYHGKQSEINLYHCPLFTGIPKRIKAARYHSLIVDKSSLPDDFNIVAHTDDNEIMAICHKEYPTIGIQFHPESIITEYGMDMIRNFLSIKK